jgi:hypothetical protein
MKRVTIIIIIIIIIVANGWSNSYKAGTRLAKASTGMVFYDFGFASPHHRIAGGNYARSVMMGAQAETREYNFTFQFTIVYSAPPHLLYELGEDLELGTH